MASSSSNRENIQQVSDFDKDGRAFVRAYPQNPKFAVWDEVFIILTDIDGAESTEGPYYIGTVIPPDRYTLCDDKGKSARNGTVIRERQLKAA